MTTKKVSSIKELRGPYRKAVAWRFINDLPEQARRVPAIDKIVVLAKNESEGRSEWQATLDGAPFRWVQREAFYGTHWRLTFNAIDGDFDSFEGAWTLGELDGQGLRMQLDMEFALDIPVLEAGIGDEIKHRVAAFSDAMMNAAADYCSESLVDQRAIPRTTILAYAGITLDGNPVRCQVRNISPRGLLLAGVEWPATGPIDVELCGSRAKAVLVPETGRARCARLVLERDLGPEEFDGICFNLRTVAQRSSTRTRIEGIAELVYPRRSVTVLVHNLSDGGMCVSGPRESLSTESFEMCGMSIDPSAVVRGPRLESWRVVFRNELTQRQVETLAAELKSDAGNDDLMVCETVTHARPGTSRIRVDETFELITRA
jgi:ribosome-associated toxin RatA of RatAB toxin-antitoxin module